MYHNQVHLFTSKSYQKRYSFKWYFLGLALKHLCNIVVSHACTVTILLSKQKKPQQSNDYPFILHSLKFGFYHTENLRSHTETELQKL